jgi:RND family efflux transporter MFP subunit
MKLPDFEGRNMKVSAAISGRRTLGALFAGVLMLGLSMGLSGCKDAKVVVAPEPPAVTVAKPGREVVANYLDFTGNTAAVRTVTVVARVEGYLQKIHFVDGQPVRKGDLLFTLQQEQYIAQLKQAKAQLDGQMASYKHAEIELPRYQRLVAQDAATQTQVDQWQSKKDQAAAGVASAKAQIDLAELNLSYTLIRAPMDGRIGRHLIDVGNLVGGAGQPTTLAQIDQIDPLYVYFTIDQRELLALTGRQRNANPQLLTQGRIPANFGLVNEEGFPHKGYLDFAALDVSSTTGTLQMRAVWPNPQQKTLPGLFTRVRVTALEKTDALLVPGDAVRFDQQGEYLLVVGANNVVERRGVKVGLQMGDKLVIRDGLGADDSVVVEGLLRAVPGQKVTPKPAVNAAASDKPAPPSQTQAAVRPAGEGPAK